jgi:hypothetical protein
MEKYNLRNFGFSASRQALFFSKTFFSPAKESREIVLTHRRDAKIVRLGLDTSRKRIEYFRRELEKLRIHFLEDSITLVLERDNVIRDTLNQIRSTDGFDFHKEIKIFFVGEEAQDAGGVFKEWIFLVLQQIFTGYICEKKQRLRKEKTSDLNLNNKRRSFSRNNRDNLKFQRNTLTRGNNEENRMHSDIWSMISQDDLINRRDERNKKEESKGKLSSSEEKISFTEKEESCERIHYMNAKKIDDNINGVTEVEYFYEFGKIPLDLANLWGRIIGKAIFEDVPISPRINHFLLKWILGQDFTLDDLKTYDPGIYSSISYMMNTDFNPSEIGITFGFINEEKYTDDVMVTNNNKVVFLELLLNYYGYQKSWMVINEFLKGFYTVVPLKLINTLTIEDLEKLLVGVKTIDISDWRLNTQYTNENVFNMHIIDWFWECICELDQQKLRKFLQFCTGWQSVPVGGFSNLRNNRQEPSPFTIKLTNLKIGMIRAHTWFNRIELPLFSSKKEIEQALSFILEQKQFIFDFE